jgi:dTDP-4-amino-4,6-dideoxygalactose transaminase
VRIPILDLKRQYAAIKPDIDAAIQRVVESGWFILGPEVEALEKEVAAYCGAKHAIGVASGTDALLLSLRALDIGPGDGVILPSFTFFATAGVVHNVGATPIFCDIDPRTFNLDSSDVRRILTTHLGQRTTDNGLRTSPKAIIPVHLYGQMADMSAIMALAEEFGLYVIEDAAQSIGAEYSGQVARSSWPVGGAGEIVPLPTSHKPLTTSHTPQATGHTPHANKAGAIGHLGCFSFFPTKNLGAYGDGGMIITDDDALADKLRKLRVHGSKPKYYHQLVGFNSRLDALQAAILRAKLPHLEAWSEARRRLADRYDTLLADIPGITLPYHVKGCSHIFHQYTIRVADGKRDALREHLKAQGIGTEIYYPLPLHLQQCFAHLGHTQGDLPESESASQEALSLPMFPELTDAEQVVVVGAVKGFQAGSS